MDLLRCCCWNRKEGKKVIATQKGTENTSRASVTTTTAVTSNPKTHIGLKEWQSFFVFFVITFFKEVKKHSSVVFHKEEKSVKSTFRWNCALCSLIQFDIFSSFLSPLTSAAHAHFDSDYCKKKQKKNNNNKG